MTAACSIRRSLQLTLPFYLAAVLSVTPTVSATGADRQAAAQRDYLNALSLLWSGETLEAVDAFYELVQLDKCGAFTCELRLAQGFRVLGDVVQAEFWARQAISKAEGLERSAAQEYNELGVCLFASRGDGPRRLDESISALRRAAELNAGRDDTYLYNLAAALEAAGQFDEAKAIFEQFESSRGLRPIIEKGEAVIGEYTPVRVVQRRNPAYTREASAEGIQGDIVLQAVIDARGRVAETIVVQGLPYGLTEAAIKALEKTKFKSATVDGKAVSAVYSQRVEMRQRQGPTVLTQRDIGRSHGHD